MALGPILDGGGGGPAPTPDSGNVSHSITVLSTSAVAFHTGAGGNTTVVRLARSLTEQRQPRHRFRGFSWN